MNSSETVFDKLTCLIEDTEILLIKKITFEISSIDELKQMVDDYFNKYEYKSSIVRGITATVSFSELLKNKLRHLSQLLEKCNSMINDFKPKNVISSDEDILLFAKKSILENRVKPLLAFVINEIELIADINTPNNKPKEELIDLYDTSGTEKILMLDELGILNFLKEKAPFNLSTNLLAGAISGITGIKVETVQSYINPMFSKNVEQKNNPRNSIKTLTKVRSKLNLLRYNPAK